MYTFLETNWDRKLSLWYTDPDSFGVLIPSENVYQELYKIIWNGLRQPVTRKITVILSQIWIPL